MRIFIWCLETGKMLSIGGTLKTVLLGERNEADSLFVEVNGKSPRGFSDVWLWPVDCSRLLMDEPVESGQRYDRHIAESVSMLWIRRLKLSVKSSTSRVSTGHCS